MNSGPNKPENKEAPVSSFKKDRRKLSHGGGHHDSGAIMQHDESNWLVSYADMMTLLFGFFVLMYSFSRIDEKKFEVIRKDVARYFGGQVRVNPTVKKLEEEIRDIMVQSGIDKQVELVARDSEIELRFNGSLHFVAGTSELTKDSAFVLSKLIDSIKRTIRADAVSVEGHTDDEPIASSVFPSNWELSTSRASTVVREFEKYGFDPSKLTAKGYGSSRPILPNRDSKGNPIRENQETNRRVIVTIAFAREIEDAIRAIKTGQFVSADAPELDPEKANNPLVREGEGEPTWQERAMRDMASIQEKLKLAEERLKDTEEKNRTAKRLAEMQDRLKQIETKIVTSEQETKKYVNKLKPVPEKATRVPAATKSSPKKKVESRTQSAPVTAPEPTPIAPSAEEVPPGPPTS